MFASMPFVRIRTNRRVCVDAIVVYAEEYPVFACKVFVRMRPNSPCLRVCYFVRMPTNSPSLSVCYSCVRGRIACVCVFTIRADADE